MDNIDDDFRGLFKTLFAALSGWRGDRVGYETVNDYIVSTVETYDKGWETAIRKTSGNWIIAARYANKEEAEKGHETWCSFLKLNSPTHMYSVQTDKIEVL